ncbi:hypothetical protein FOZ60_003663 [Perkinsus olseni]|uniref:Uncharacterized protein n=1 Tax=Perkinsus olseni TaxID=32597 RepID=A0A7J6PI52_PEROL|nr:hypothetical protein FOZ60_003663 [Perkinsus olseni]
MLVSDWRLRKLILDRASKPVQKVDAESPVDDAKAPVTDATAPEAVPDTEALKGNAMAPVLDARPPPADTKAPVLEARPPPADTKALVMDKKVPVVESKSPSGVPRLMVTSTEVGYPFIWETFSADSADVADEGTAEDIRTADVSHDSLHKHSSEPKLADAAGKGEALASPVDQQRTADGRQTPPDDFWGSDTASPIVGHGVSNTGNAAVFAISTPDGDHVQPKGAQGATVSFSPETAGGERGRAGSFKGGAKQKKGDDSGDTSFTRRSTGVATLFEDDEVSTSAIFGPGNAKDDGLDFDSILNSEPSTPFMQGPGQQGPAQYTNGPNYQQQQPAAGARPYGSRSGQSSGYSSAANSMGSWNNSNSSWNYVEQQQPRQQQQSPYTSSSSGGSFPAQQPNSPYPTSARGQGASLQPAYYSATARMGCSSGSAGIPRVTAAAEPLAATEYPSAEWSGSAAVQSRQSQDSEDYSDVDLGSPCIFWLPLPSSISVRLRPFSPFSM